MQILDRLGMCVLLVEGEVVREQANGVVHKERVVGKGGYEVNPVLLEELHELESIGYGVEAASEGVVVVLEAGDDTQREGLPLVREDHVVVHQVGVTLVVAVHGAACWVARGRLVKRGLQVLHASTILSVHSHLHLAQSGLTELRSLKKSQ